MVLQNRTLPDAFDAAPVDRNSLLVTKTFTRLIHPATGLTDKGQVRRTLHPAFVQGTGGLGTEGAASGAGPETGGSLTMIWKLLVSARPGLALSVTVTPKKKLPSTTGVPLIAPV
jgi:hypothetical protein